jgi:hypothetical protein
MPSASVTSAQRDELLRRDRRSSGRRKFRAVDRGTSRHLGFHRHCCLRLRCSGVPAPHAQGRGSLEQAGALALAAGIDVELPKTLCYGEPLMAEIEAGRAHQALVDRALRRVLAQKLDLGLLDVDWSPDNLTDIVDLDSPANRAIARRIAESSIILLENRAGVLPLEAPKRIAVIGPRADDPQAFFGCYSFPNHVLPQYPDFQGNLGIEAKSLLTALRREFPAAESQLPARLRSCWWRPLQTGGRRRGG